ncbi:LacI family DNA-binding transcriptional regulator [Ornithinimicrobium sp. INDO-MA30-4]|uniref:LacI family DNA-binding transcriptional regulator n=1 Tax=Ornithinimicrobium sp. INDO-MA30-4 TaxID=2908651 RepID=UPI001F3AF382|nr:LacI family DNA-binding transcriptional regulator [Ornithinimicrobium sp. INDO-MA30-4]UJH69994.1 LacI family transcriptional regulator [Ornithinimicrobium sp. INDO-MA30-4]
MTTNRRRAVLRDVAELASVSIKTASRVLNDDPAVAEPTRAAVVRAMEALDYQPDPAARSLRAGKDRMVGVVIDSVGDVFFSRMVARIESVLNAAGYLALIASSNRNEQAERDVVQAFVQRRCAGIIVAPITPASLHGLGLRDTPIVFVDRIGDLPQTPPSCPTTTASGGEPPNT